MCIGENKVAVQAAQTLLITQGELYAEITTCKTAKMLRWHRGIPAYGHIFSRRSKCFTQSHVPAAQHSTAQHSTAQHSTAQHSSFKRKHCDNVDN